MIDNIYFEDKRQQTMDFEDSFAHTFTHTHLYLHLNVDTRACKDHFGQTNEVKSNIIKINTNAE